jgi:predicted outer membrane protein
MSILPGAGGLMPVILGTQGAEIRRIVVRSQPGQIVHKTLSQKKKKKSQKRAAGPDFKPQYHKKQQQKDNSIITLTVKTGFTN